MICKYNRINGQNWALKKNMSNFDFIIDFVTLISHHNNTYFILRGTRYKHLALKNLLSYYVFLWSLINTNIIWIKIISTVWHTSRNCWTYTKKHYLWNIDVDYKMLKSLDDNNRKKTIINYSCYILNE